MEDFILLGQGGFLKLSIEEVFGFPDRTCHLGGYDTKSTIEIKSGNYYVKGEFYTSTGELFEFYEQLTDCYDRVNGSAKFLSSEQNLDLTVEFNEQGHIRVFGTFSEYAHRINELKFEFETDQTFITSTLNELQSITRKYGGMKGIEK